MRLHHLKMTAFQPFATTEEVDFDALGEAGLFLMQGETGAGKTAILDAICFALFGRVPGARDSAPRLRSDHSSGDRRTEVVLELTLSGRRLRVTRSPKQERPKVRGEGLTEEPARATLEVRDSGGKWAVLAERIEAVEHELDELLGLTISQFCQVVLLPQGAFARFLHAGTDERERLLQQLFDTEGYAGAQEWLGEARRDADGCVFDGLGAVGDIASRIAQVTDEEPPEGWRKAPDQLTEWVQSRLVLAQASDAAAEGTADAALAARDAAARGHAQAQLLAERRAQHAAAVAELSRREAAGSERAAAAARLEQARRAGAAAILAEQAQAAEHALARERHSAEHALADAGIAAEEPAALQLTFEAEPFAPAPPLEAAGARARAGDLREQAALARACVADEARLGGERSALEATRRQAAEAAVEVEGHDAWLESAAVRQAELTNTVERAQAAASELPGLQQAAVTAAERAAAGGRRDSLSARLQAENEARRDAQSDELDARQAWLDARQRRLDGIAAELAGELRDGEPCRVCGALEHPAPAHAGDGAVVTAAAERELERRLEAATARHAAAREQVAETERELSAAQALAGDAAASELEAAATEAAGARDAAEALAAEVGTAQAALDAHGGETEARQLARAQARESVARLESDVAARAQAIAEAQVRVDLARAEFRTIEARLAWLDEQSSALERAADALERWAHARHEHDRSRRAAREQAQIDGFASADAALAAALPAPGLSALAAQIEAFDAELARLRGLAEDPDLVAAAAAPAPDSALATAALAAREQELETAQRELAIAGKRAGELDALAAELGRRMEALAPLVERQQLVQAVAGLADGSSPANRMRMPLSAYVLTARLEQIAEAASTRLERMSGGRYALAHCDERVGRSRKGGLGLEVLDGWTGRERPPGSLSGGETFQASLALALGLADVVSAEAGGARLETLFVDEGFGSLGDRALDDVLDVLDGLREGGRAVGVISHVSEMRQRIPVQLHVEKGRSGSRIRQA